MLPGSDTDPDATATSGSPTPEPGAPTSAGHAVAAHELAAFAGRALHADRGGRYAVGESIGRGGMGEVFVARDLDIGRAVAVKRMRSAAPTTEATARFLREARIQGWLEHPAIVPVHDLGIDASGRPFFTMKRLTGTTLAAILARPRDPAQLRRLLRALVEVCLAVEFAHASGVIHRDLKPGNIMLGDFGEVYVLDWGVARIVGVDDITADGDSADSAERMTQPGAILGTPAYMAPEQRRGALDVGPAADVYSLGCILFEILAGQPLAPTASERAMPIDPIDPRPSARGVDVAPELEAACVAAIAADPAARPSARALSDRLQHYLDGDRDAEQRRALAADHVRAATAALAGDGPDADRRAAAMRRAGQALALDPTSTAAAQIVSRLVLEPPPIAPPEVTQLLADRDRETITRQGYLAARSLGTSAVIVALLMWLFVRSWPLTLAVFAVFAASAAHAYRTSRANRTFRPLDIAYILGSNVVILVLLSRLFGVYLIVPAIATAAMSGLAVLPPLLGAYNRVWLAFAAGLVIPAVLETAGVWARTTTFAANGVVIAPLGTEVPAGAELLVLAAVLALLYAAGRYVRDLATANRAAQARLELQAWHLRQLIPPAA